MRHDPIKLNKEQARPFLKITFPDYKGKKFMLRKSEKYYMNNYWDGGTRDYVMGIMIQDGIMKSFVPDNSTSNPFKGASHADFEIPLNVIMVEHSIFCGKDVGISLIVHPESPLVPKMITA
jgi:hypothetical protein